MSGRPAPAEAQGHKEGKELKLDHWHPSDLKNVGDSQWRDQAHRVTRHHTCSGMQRLWAWRIPCARRTRPVYPGIISLCGCHNYY